jgi:hypothetical protein
MAEKRNSSQDDSTAGFALLGLGAAAVAYFAFSGGGGIGGGGGGFGSGGGQQQEPDTVPNRGGMDGDPNTSPVEDTAPESASGEPQTQTIASGTMTGPDEETTMEERSKRREMTSSTEDPDTIADRGNTPEESNTVSSETMSGETATERGQQREAFSSTEDPGSILDNISEEDKESIEETRSGNPTRRVQDDGSVTITGGGL